MASVFQRRIGDAAFNQSWNEVASLSRNVRRANLIFRHHRTVEIGAAVGQVRIQPLPSTLKGEAVAPADDFLWASFDPRPVLGDLGADLVDVEIDVHLISDGLLMVVFDDEVLFREPERLFRGRRREADQEGVVVIEHLWVSDSSIVRRRLVARRGRDNRRPTAPGLDPQATPNVGR